MADTSSCPGVNVYRLRVVVAGISPLIWRRLEVTVGTTVARLHAIVQTAFGWSGEHLHRFVIGGTEYGISYLGGPGFRDDARQVRLAGLGLREGERFAYEYNFYAAWRVDLRVEQIAWPSRGGSCREELADLAPLLGLERFDRRACNQALHALAPAAEGSRA